MLKKAVHQQALRRELSRESIVGKHIIMQFIQYAAHA